MSGVGVHGGLSAQVTLKPRSSPEGVLLNGAPLSAWRIAPAQWATRLTLDRCAGSSLGASLPNVVSTPEHLLAALYGSGVDDVEVEVTRVNISNHAEQVEEVEIPILDGSAAPYLRRIEVTPTAGGIYQREVTPLPQLYIRGEGGSILSRPEPLKGAEGELSLRLSCSLSELYPELACQGDETAHERQAALLSSSRVSRSVALLGLNDFVTLIAPARTFGLRAHEAILRARGLIRGVSLENTIALDARGEPHVALRHPDELVAHKLLDVLGDLALSGRRWRGHLEVRRGSHALNHTLLRHLGRDEPQRYRFD